MSHKGFTLIEILIALFIFTIVALIVTSGIHTTFTTQTATEKNAARLAELQMAMMFVSRDFQQAINRPVSNENGEMETAFIGTSNHVILTHTGAANPLGNLPQSTLQRVRYRLENDILLRETWPVLDMGKFSQPSRRYLLTQVVQLQFEYLDQEKKFQKQWPPAGEAKAKLPAAVRVSITLADLGKITQLYLLSGQGNDQPE